MAIELVPLCTMRLQSKPAIEVGTGPAGTRLIVDCISVEVKGERLSGQMEGRTSGDWILIAPRVREPWMSARRFAPMTAH
ncbi:MAG TPA: DUF3237 family protein [Kribbella sp.]